MQNSSGLRATDEAESRRNWRAHGAELGKWDPLDPKYDRDFASEIQEAVDGIAQTEDTEAGMRVELLLSELLPPSHGAAAGDADPSDDGQQAAGIHDQLADDDTAPPGTRNQHRLLPPVNSDGGRLRITTPTYASYHDLTELDRLSDPLRS